MLLRKRQQRMYYDVRRRESDASEIGRNKPANTIRHVRSGRCVCVSDIASDGLRNGSFCFSTRRTRKRIKRTFLLNIDAGGHECVRCRLQYNLLCENERVGRRDSDLRWPRTVPESLISGSFRKFSQWSSERCNRKPGPTRIVHPANDRQSAMFYESCWGGVAIICTRPVAQPNVYK
jgi:hypothetical protein